MVANRIAPERAFRGPGCTEACVVVQVIIPQRYGRSDLLLHDAASHEAFGRRHAPASEVQHGLVATGPLRVDLARGEIALDGAIWETTPVLTRLLFALTRVAGACASWRYLREDVWGDSYLYANRATSLHLLRCNITRLRAALGPAGELIATVKGMGYRLELLEPGATVALRVRYASGRSAGGWSTHFARCVCCGGTQRPYHGHGRCTLCYGTPSYGRYHYGPCQQPPPQYEERTS